jgi:hypothetical protein
MAKGKIKFLKKDPMKSAGGVALRFGLRTAGAVGGAALANVVTKPGSSGKALLDKKFAGPALMGLGLVGEMLIEDDNIRAPFEGMSTIGAFQTIANIEMDGVKVGAKLGLGNVMESESEEDLGSLAENELDDLIEEARTIQGAEDSAIPSYNEDAPISGMDDSQEEQIPFPELSGVDIVNQLL